MRALWVTVLKQDEIRRAIRPKSVPLAAALLVLVAVGTMAARVDAAPKSRPNIVFIMADDLGYGDTGYTGHPIIKTPNIDRLAAAGIRLTQNYSGAPNCSPSRAVLLTGRAAHRVGFYEVLGRGGRGMELKPSEVTIAELLHDAGYQTFHGGKWHPQSRRFGSPLVCGQEMRIHGQ